MPNDAQGKKGRVGPSPLGIKAMARTAAAPSPMATVPEERPQRARRAAAAAPPRYNVDGSESASEDKDSDFEVLSE